VKPSELFRSGQHDPKTIALFIGHKDPALTLRVYGRPWNQEEATTALAAAL